MSKPNFDTSICYNQVKMYLIAHYLCEVLQQFLVCPELLPADRDDGAFEELVVVDEEPDLASALLRRDVQQRRPVAGAGVAQIAGKRKY